MAGFTRRENVGGTHEFHIGEPHIGDLIREVNNHKRVITLQLDGDELDAALWGLDNYRKPTRHSVPLDPA